MSMPAKLQSWFFAMLVVGAVGLVPRHAAATRIITMPISGYATLGMKGDTTWLAVQPPSGGACTFFRVSDYGHLDDDLEIFGSNGSDWIGVVIASGSNGCGNWQPVNYDGHLVYIYGQAGSDVIFGGTEELIYGGPNDDLIYGGWIEGLVEGNDGNDYLYGHDSPFDFLSGSNGNDHLCEHSNATAFEMIGGAGSNTRCGTAFQIVDKFTINCSICGSGY